MPRLNKCVSSHSTKGPPIHNIRLVSLIHAHHLHSRSRQGCVPSLQCDSNWIFIQDGEVKVPFFIHAQGSKIQDFLRWRSGEKGVKDPVKAKQGHIDVRHIGLYS